MKLILWSSIPHNFIGEDYLFTKTLVSDGKCLGSQTLRKSPMICVPSPGLFFGIHYDNLPAQQNYILTDT